MQPANSSLAASPGSSAFQNRLSSLSDGQKRAYSYLRAPTTSVSSDRVDLPNEDNRVENKKGSAFAAATIDEKRRRNSVVGGSTRAGSPAVCKELVDLDLHSSFALNLGENEKRGRLQSDFAPRPSNPLATWFERQCTTPEPSFA